MCHLLKCKSLQITDKNVIKIHFIPLYLSIASWKVLVYSNIIHIWQYSWKATALVWGATIINKLQGRKWYSSYKKGISSEEIWKISVVLKLLYLLLLSYEIIYLFIFMSTIWYDTGFILLLKQKIQNSVVYYGSIYHIDKYLTVLIFLDKNLKLRQNFNFNCS